jgi:rubredoxin
MPNSDRDIAPDATSTRKWMCVNCGYVYEQDKGDPAGGIAPGTAWEDIPEDWICPECGAEKSVFEMTEL